MKKLIVRIKGGLGNQLFCYAAARSLAILNDAELLIDGETGFLKDEYSRCYELNHFNIKCKTIQFNGLLRFYFKIKRNLFKLISKFQKFENKKYIEQEFIDFDERLLNIKLSGTKYIEGLWQSENYFKDNIKVIREDLRLSANLDPKNIELLQRIDSKMSVALHIRWFDEDNECSKYNLSPEYYIKAIEYISGKLNNPYYFVFSDKPESVLKKLNLLESNFEIVSHNDANKGHLDLMLMSKCNHFVIANSTFSWWGAWLSDKENKIVIAPSIKHIGKAAWGFSGLIPDSWHKI